MAGDVHLSHVRFGHTGLMELLLIFALFAAVAMTLLVPAYRGLARGG